jgi:hypothetical protein
MIKRENLKRFLAVAFWLAASVLLLLRIGHAATFFVSQSGTEAKATATSVSTPMSVTTHNASAFSPGDEIYLLDTITSRIVVPSSGASGNYITYRGDYPDHTALLQPSNLGFSTGAAFGFNGKDWIKLHNNTTRAVIDGQVTSGTVDELFSASDNKDLVDVTNTDNCIVDNWEIKRGYGGIYSQAVTNFKVTRCKFSQNRLKGVALSDIWSNVTIGGSAGMGNEFDRNGYKILYADNKIGFDIYLYEGTGFIVSHNDIHGTIDGGGEDGWGIIGLAIYGASDGVIEYNTIHDMGGKNFRGAMHFKGLNRWWRNFDTIVRYNNIYDLPLNPEWVYVSGSAISMTRDTYNFRIYGNRIHNALGGIKMDINGETGVTDGANGYHVQDIYAWGNSLSGIKEFCFGAADGYSANTDDYDDIWFVNNSCSFAAETVEGDLTGPIWSGFNYGASTDGTDDTGTNPHLHVKNNIIADGRSGLTPKYNIGPLWATADGNWIDLDYNLNYSSTTAGTYNVKWGSTVYAYDSTSLPAAWGANDPAPADPGFTSASTGDLTIGPTSPAVGAGDDLSSTTIPPLTVEHYSSSPQTFTFDEILSAESDFSVHPPAVTMALQYDYGDPDIGAFVYSSYAVYPNATITSPIGNQTIEEGESLTFTADVTCTTNTPCTYLWNFDGGAVNSTSEDAGATAFATAGVYNVTLTVTDAASVADPTPAQVTVTVRAATGANDYTGNTNVKGLWVFENNLNDTSGNGNNLTGSGSPAYDSSTEIEGDYSLDLEAGSSQFASIADASLASGFPFKGATTEAPWTILAKFRLESLPAVGARMIIASKYEYTNNLRSFYLGVENVGGTTYPTFAIGYADGVSNDPEFHGSAVTAGVNYAIALVFDNVTDEYTFALYNLDAAALVGTNATGDLTSTVNGGWCNTAAAFDVGKIGPSNTYYFDGLIDEVVVLSQEFSTTEISAYFAGNYSVSTAEIVRIYSSTPTGYYKEGDTTAPFFVEFADAISWAVGAGSIKLTLVNDTGDDVAVDATYASGSGSTIEFDGLVVPDGFNTADLDAVTLAAAGGATIKVSGTTTDADLTVPTDPDSRSLDRNGRIVIDDTVDTIASVVGVSDDASSFTDPDGYIDIAVNLPSTDGYHVGYTTAWPKVGLAVGDETLYAEYVGKTDANTLVFRLELEPGNRDPDGIEIAGDLVLTGATLTDMAGNTVLLTMPASPNTLADDSTYVVAVPKDLSTGTAWWVGTGFDAATFDLLDLVDGDRILIAE